METANKPKRGRPPKLAGRPYKRTTLSLPAGDVDRLTDEARATGQESLSAVVRIAVSEHLRRADKRRARIADTEE
jgi:hypothetical protein